MSSIFWKLWMNRKECYPLLFRGFWVRFPAVNCIFFFFFFYKAMSCFILSYLFYVNTVLVIKINWIQNSAAFVEKSHSPGAVYTKPREESWVWNNSFPLILLLPVQVPFEKMCILMLKIIWCSLSILKFSVFIIFLIILDCRFSVKHVL